MTRSALEVHGRHLTTTIAGIIHSFPRRQRVLLLFMVTALTVAPVVLTLARPSNYVADVELVAVPHGRVAQVKLVSDVRKAVRNPFVRVSIIQRAAMHDAASLVNKIEVAQASGQDKSSVVVRVPGAKPQQARQLANAAAFALVANSRSPAQFRAALNDRVTKIERTLRSASVSPAQRSALREQEQNARRTLVGIREPSPLTLARPVRTPAGSGLERAFHGLPGHPRSRPNPVWAGIAGFLVGMALCAAWLLTQSDVGRGVSRVEPAGTG